MKIFYSFLIASAITPFIMLLLMILSILGWAFLWHIEKRFGIGGVLLIPALIVFLVSAGI